MRGTGVVISAEVKHAIEIHKQELAEMARTGEYKRWIGSMEKYVAQKQPDLNAKEKNSEARALVDAIALFGMMIRDRTEAQLEREQGG